MAVGLSGCSPVAAHSAGPELLYVAGGNELRAVGVEDLKTVGSVPLAGPVVAGVAQGQSLQLLIGGAEPAWMELDTKTQRVLRRQRLDFVPVAMAAGAHAGEVYILGNRAGQAHLLGWNTGGGRLGASGFAGRAVALAAGRNDNRPLLLAGVDQPPQLVVTDPKGLQVLGRVGLVSAPRQVLALPYGHKAFVLCGSTVAVVDTALPGLLTYLRLGRDPQWMLLKPDGGELYVSNADGTVSVVNTTTNEVSDTMAAGLGAGAMAVDAGGNFLYVANATAGTVSVISIADRRTQAVIHVGQQPRSLALDPAGLLLFAADAVSDDVAVMRSSQDPGSPNSLLTLLPSPGAPTYVAVVPQ